MDGENRKMNKLRFGIIGVGGICNGVHLPAYDKIENSEIVALCDINPSKLDAIKDRYPSARLYTDYMKMIDTEKLDAVDICTPNYLHSTIAVYALSHGINVMCEKPDAINASEAEKMRAAAKESGKTLMVMRNNRYRPTTLFLKEFIKDGRMGEIYSARCGWIRRRGIPGRGGWFTTKEQSGGGPLIDLGVHMIDLAMYLMGNPKPVTVSGSAYSKFSGAGETRQSTEYRKRDTVSGGTFDVEDLAMGFIRFDNGACLQIEFSWASNIEKDEMFVELRGDKAGSKMSSTDRRVHIFTEEYGTLVNIEPDIDDYKGMQHHEANIRHFIDVIANGASPDFVPEQGVNMVKILEALYKSAEEGHEITL